MAQEGQRVTQQHSSPKRVYPTRNERQGNGVIYPLLYDFVLHLQEEKGEAKGSA